MAGKTALKIITTFALIGVLFSGYLTYYTFTSGHSGCEVFIAGMPSCFYGLIMYLVVFVLALWLSLKKATRTGGTGAMSVISLIGVFFAAYLTLTMLSNVSCTTLEIYGIPPCVYGLVMYLLLLVIALFELKKK